MRISSTNAIEGGRVLYTIGSIEAASAWHPAHGSPLQENWRELVVRELMRKAEDIDADAIIRVDYHNDGVIRIDETGVKFQARGCHRHCGEAFLRRLMPGCRHHARVSPVSAARKEKCPRRSAERHMKACPEDRQCITLVLVARHEILMFPFERIRDVDRPARQEQAVLRRQLARYGGRPDPVDAPWDGNVLLPTRRRYRH